MYYGLWNSFCMLTATQPPPQQHKSGTGWIFMVWLGLFKMPQNNWKGVLSVTFPPVLTNSFLVPLAQYQSFPDFFLESMDSWRAWRCTHTCLLPVLSKFCRKCWPYKSPRGRSGTTEIWGGSQQHHHFRASTPWDAIPPGGALTSYALHSNVHHAPWC